MEGVDAIMTAFVAAAVVDSTACHNGHIRSVCHIKIVVHQIRHSGHTEHYRNKYLLSLGLSVNENVDAGLVSFLFDFDMLAVPVAECNSILTEIVGSLLDKSAADFFQNLLGRFINLYHQFFPPSHPVRHF